MSNILVDKLRPGMIIAIEVKDRMGRVLLPAGVEIQDKHIRGLKMWGVTEVQVEGGDSAPEAVEEQTAQPRASIGAGGTAGDDEELNRLFRHTDLDHPLIQQLYHQCQLKKQRHG